MFVSASLKGSFQASVPPGVSDGTLLSVKGQGSAGKDGGESGNLWVCWVPLPPLLVAAIVATAAVPLLPFSLLLHGSADVRFSCVFVVT